MTFLPTRQGYPLFYRCWKILYCPRVHITPWHALGHVQRRALDSQHNSACAKLLFDVTHIALQYMLSNFNTTKLVDKKRISHRYEVHIRFSIRGIKCYLEKPRFLLLNLPPCLPHKMLMCRSCSIVISPNNIKLVN